MNDTSKTIQIIDFIFWGLYPFTFECFRASLSSTCNDCWSSKSIGSFKLSTFARLPSFEPFKTHYGILTNLIGLSNFLEVTIESLILFFVDLLNYLHSLKPSSKILFQTSHYFSEQHIFRIYLSILQNRRNHKFLDSLYIIWLIIKSN